MKIDPTDLSTGDPNTTPSDAIIRYWKKISLYQEKIKLSKNLNFDYFDYLSHIPKIPEELVTYDIEKILNMPNNNVRPWPVKYLGNIKTTDSNKNNKIIDGTSKIYEFLYPYFGNNIEVSYQVMTTQLPIHIDDHHRGSFVANYVLLTGGNNVRTRHWQLPENIVEEHDDYVTADGIKGDLLGRDHLLHEINIPPKRWHRLQTDIPHDISKINTPRLGITVFQNK